MPVVVVPVVLVSLLLLAGRAVSLRVEPDVLLEPEWWPLLEVVLPVEDVLLDVDEAVLLDDPPWLDPPLLAHAAVPERASIKVIADAMDVRCSLFMSMLLNEKCD